MYSDKDILARLQRGESADDIAKEMASALNQAVAADKRAKEEAAKAAATKRVQDLDPAVKCINDYIAKWYPDHKDELTVDAQTLDELIDTLNDIGDLLAVFGNFEAKKRPARRIRESKSTDPIGDFLKHYNL